MHTELEIILKLIVAGILGGVLGLERESVHKPAGLRTYILVTLAAALTTSLALTAFSPTGAVLNPAGSEMLARSFDPLRLVAALLTGIGFIGAGVIIHRNDHHVEGITTAAGLWMTTVIGVTVGVGYFLVAVVTTLLALFIFFVLAQLEEDKD